MMILFSRYKLLFSILLILLFFAILYLFNHNYKYDSPTNQKGTTYERAKIIKVLNESLIPDKDINGLYAGTQQLEIKILSGAYKGETKTVKNYLTSQINVYGRPGIDIIARIDIATPTIYTISVYNYDRAPVWGVFIILFFAALCLIGGKKGIKSVISLLFTFICILFLFVPMIFRGYDPLFASILITIIMTCVTLLLLDGWSAKTLSAITGTILGVIVAAIAASIIGAFSHLTGFNTSDAESLIVIANKTHMQIQGVLFASVLIASLGAVMDIAMSIASSINEVYQSNRTLSKKKIFMSGMNVGRDMMGTMVNTLILAFTGASLTFLILLFSYNISFNQLMSMDLVGVEIMQGLTGSAAVIFTVPITAFICSRIIPALSVKVVEMDTKSNLII